MWVILDFSMCQKVLDNARGRFTFSSSEEYIWILLRRHLWVLWPIFTRGRGDSLEIHIISFLSIFFLLINWIPNAFSSYLPPPSPPPPPPPQVHHCTWICTTVLWSPLLKKYLSTLNETVSKKTRVIPKHLEEWFCSNLSCIRGLIQLGGLAFSASLHSSYIMIFDVNYNLTYKDSIPNFIFDKF